MAQVQTCDCVSAREKSSSGWFLVYLCAQFVHVAAMQHTLVLFQHLQNVTPIMLNGVWLDVCLRTDTEKRYMF